MGVGQKNCRVEQKNNIKFHASDQLSKNPRRRKKKIGHSMSGNRTRGVCVTGRNVTNYTNTDLFLFQNLKHCIRSLMFEFQRVRCCNQANISSFDQTTMNIPHPIRTAKSSIVGPNQYCGGGPRGNLGCRMFFLSRMFFFSRKKKDASNFFSSKFSSHTPRFPPLQNAPPMGVKKKKRKKNKPANRG